MGAVRIEGDGPEVKTVEYPRPVNEPSPDPVDTQAGPYFPDRFVAVTSFASGLVGCLLYPGELSDPAVNIVLLMLSGIIDLGIGRSRRWAFVLTAIFGIIGVATIPFLSAPSLGEALLSYAPGFAVSAYCAVRLTRRLGPAFERRRTR